MKPIDTRRARSCAADVVEGPSISAVPGFGKDTDVISRRGQSHLAGFRRRVRRFGRVRIRSEHSSPGEAPTHPIDDLRDLAVRELRNAAKRRFASAMTA